MLDNPGFNKISIKNYKQERFPTFIFKLFVFVAF